MSLINFYLSDLKPMHSFGKTRVLTHKRQCQYAYEMHEIRKVHFRIMHQWQTDSFLSREREREKHRHRGFELLITFGSRSQATCIDMRYMSLGHQHVSHVDGQAPSNS